MDATTLKQKRDHVVERFGPWTAHCIHLGNGIYTFDLPQAESRMRRVLQIAADIVGKSLDEIRVLDLGCLEAQFGIEFALHGSEVTAIEGREVNLAKCQFTKSVLSLDKLHLILDDVRNLGQEKYGDFDVVLCLGILYHLDDTEAATLIQRIYEVCSRVIIIDTHISSEDETSFAWNGRTYWGQYSVEHSVEATHEEQLKALWNSIDNVKSFHFTRASLCNLLRDVGFTSVYECLNPYEYHNPAWPLPFEGSGYAVWKDRSTFVAIKGRTQRIMSSPITDLSPEINRPEKAQFLLPAKRPGRAESPGLKQKISAVLPEPLRKILRRIVHLILRQRQ